MGCNASREVIPIDAKGTRDHRKIQYNEDKSIISYLRGRTRSNSNGGKNTITSDTSNDKEGGQENEKKYIELKDISSLPKNVKIHKYKYPFDSWSCFEDTFIFNSTAEVAVQPDSWYQKPRPKLRIEIATR